MKMISRCGLVLMALVACAGVSAAQTPVKFTLDWKYEGTASPFLLAHQKGYYKAEGLDLTIDTGNGSLDAIPKIASGTYQIGLGDINSLIRFRDQNPAVDIKMVMMLFDKPTFAILGRKSLGVNTLADLAGKTVGAPPPDGAFAQWPTFSKINNIDTSKIKIESIGFPVREPMLARGTVQAVFGFSFAVYLNLKAAGVPENDISVILMADHGLDLYGNGIMINPGFAAANPELVKGFLRATIKGVKETLRNPAASIPHVLAVNDVAKLATETERLEMAIAQNIATAYVKAKGFGDVDMDRLSRSIKQIGIAYDFKTSVKAEDVFTSKYLPSKEERRID
jgi:NitT/TauT family transport system substrate-binding protein